jgi:Gas vesicle protein
LFLDNPVPSQQAKESLISWLSQRNLAIATWSPAPSSLADVIDTMLDKGLVIDIYVRVSLVGIELLTIDARIVIASVDTYLRFAEADAGHSGRRRCVHRQVRGGMGLTPWHSAGDLPRLEVIKP